ncbi:MAG: CoA activase, partial [Acidobacteriota bacterium]|nr:CoA activase [Acidobacteriota bacterium]
MPATPHLIGLDVGSTTVKAVAIDPATGAAVWSGYERHETRQLEKALEFLQRLEADLHVDREPCRIFVTGSGGQALAPLVGGAFVQEVTALSVAVERLHPDVHAVIELGGQDAKIIVFQDDPVSGHRKKIPSMNDKCAGGTGAVIDKINAKLRIPPDRLGDQGFAGIRRHPVAGKCGVFAETDINSLQKAGVPPDELMASLFEAIVLQNLTVLARGHTLRPAVLLLGGPNTFIRGLREAWQHHIPKLWAERGVAVPPGRTPEELIYAPDHAQYFSAIGAVIFGRDEDDETVGRYRGTAALERYLAVGRREARRASGTRGLSASPGELAAFRDRFAPKPFVPAVFRAGDVVQGLVGLDGGSTSTKAALLSPDGDVLCTAYQLSQGNPIRDTIEIVGRLRGQVEAQGARLDVLGVCTTGYAKDVLRDVLRADAAIVETVAHTESAVKYYGRPDVIVDVGGQDIKIIVLRDGRVKDFRLNTQCSAGNGYFLQATAEAFGVPLDEYAGRAFSAHSMPVFGYGCAVFLQTDIVNFQRQGWTANEILAGLAAVLPKNVFLYVAKMPHLSRLGTRFVLQGGTQRNLAVVKAEVDFIEAAFEGSGERPEIVVHEHCAESGAIGAAVEAQRLWRLGRKTTFIGLDAVAGIRYRTTRSEETRCHFCRNACLRTFIDIGEAEAEAAPAPEAQVPAAFRSAVPKAAGERRLIVATCEKGAAEDPDRLRAIRATLDAARRANPNLVDEAARSVWKMRSPAIVADPVPARAWTRAARARAEARRRRPQLRIGLPR